MRTKVCDRCNKLKELTEFKINKSNSDGRLDICKQCNKEIRIEKRLLTYKKCSMCNESFPRNDKYFYKSTTSVDGLQGKCIKCTKEIGKTKRETARKYSAGNYLSGKVMPKPTLTIERYKNLEIKEGTTLEVILNKNKKKLKEFKGSLVNQTDRFITLKHSEFGYLETFMKVDFFTGERELKEVI